MHRNYQRKFFLKYFYTEVSCACFFSSGFINAIVAKIGKLAKRNSVHWFKCKNYSLYDIEHISRNTTGITYYLLYLGQQLIAKCVLQVHGKHYTTKSCIFGSQYICSA